MRKPVRVFLVARHLRLVRAVGVHPPDLHDAGAHRVEPDAPVGRVVRPIVEARRRGEPALVAALDRNRVDVVLALAPCAVGQRPAVRRPAVPVRRAVLGNQTGLAAGRGHDVDQRVAFGRVADGEPRAIGREAVVVVAARGRPRVEQPRCPISERQHEDPPALVEEERLPIPRPVGRFEVRRRGPDDFTLAGGDCQDLQTAFDPRA